MRTATWRGGSSCRAVRSQRVARHVVEGLRPAAACPGRHPRGGQSGKRLKQTASSRGRPERSYATRPTPGMGAGSTAGAVRDNGWWALYQPGAQRRAFLSEPADDHDSGQHRLLARPRSRRRSEHRSSAPAAPGRVRPGSSGTTRIPSRASESRSPVTILRPFPVIKGSTRYIHARGEWSGSRAPSSRCRGVCITTTAGRSERGSCLVPAPAAAEAVHEIQRGTGAMPLPAGEWYRSGTNERNSDRFYHPPPAAALVTTPIRRRSRP